MNKQISYRELAKYYDEIYSWKDYKTEAHLIDLIVNGFGSLPKSKNRRARLSLLDVACGTGEHIKYFKKKYSVTGADLSAEMLAVARKKLPGIKFKKADMTSFNFNQKYDVIVCLFAAIGHLKTYRKLRMAFQCFEKHLKPGGVLIVEPFLTPNAYRPGMPHSIYVKKPNLQIARSNVSSLKDGQAVLDFHYLIATPKGVNTYRDHVTLGLFDSKHVLAIMRECGLRAKFLNQGLTKHRGLYIGAKPQEAGVIRSAKHR